jgi:CRISPR system Cascade subunit CasA
MNEYFNLLDEPWLPVRLADGSTQDLGLFDIFARSGDIVALAETSPPSLVAEYRLLLAITHRALVHSLKSWKDKERAGWYRDGLPLDVIRDYLEKWRGRFALFHPQYPFMQVAALGEAEETRDKRKPWTQISLASASGNTPAVFDHAFDDLPDAISPAKVIGALLGFLQFTPGGLVKTLRDSDKAGALANTAAVIPVGSTLAKTLCLCLHPAPTGHGDDDKPAWEGLPLTVVQLRGEPILATGPNDRYTRQSRAVMLLREDDGKVRWLRFAVGLALGEGDNAPDPMASFREGKDKLVRMTFSEGRALWRDLPVLTPSGKGRAAAILDHAIGLRRDISGGDVFQAVLVAGLCSDQAKLLRWRVEQLLLPTALLIDVNKAQDLRDLVEKAEALFNDLRALATTLLAETLPDSSSKDTRDRAREILNNSPLAASYFAAAERTLPQVMDLIADSQFEQAEAMWGETLRSSAFNAWEQVRSGLGQSARALRADAKCWPRLHGLLNKHVPKDKFPESETVEMET